MTRNTAPVVDSTNKVKTDEEKKKAETTIIPSYSIGTPRQNGNVNSRNPCSKPFTSCFASPDSSMLTPSTSASSSPSMSPSPSPKLNYFALLSNENQYSLHSHSSSERFSSSWVAPASMKSLRTHNPIRAIVDPIMSSSLKSGKERGDGKDQISLAVSLKSVSITITFSQNAKRSLTNQRNCRWNYFVSPFYITKK